MRRTLSIAVLGISVFAIPSAFAADGYLTGDVNLRAGPDSSYPSVVMLPEGAPVAIEGCVDGWSWCDVSAGDNRGWVAGNFLQEEYQGQRVLVPEYGVRIGIPVVSFVFSTYWDNNYRGRSWYGDRQRWSHVTPQYRSVSGHDERHDTGHQGVDTHTNRVSAGTSRESAHPATESKQVVAGTARTTARPANQDKTKPVVSQHALASQAHPAERTATPAKPTTQHAVQPRVASQTAAVHKTPQPAIAAEHKPAAVRKEVPEKDTQEKKDNGGKDEH